MLERVKQSLKVTNDDYRKTLMQFTSAGDVEAIESLLDNHPEINIDINSPKSKNTALHTALVQNQQGFIIDYLISKGADINAFNLKGFNPVVLAIRHCRPGTQALDKLIHAGASLKRFERGRFIGLSALDIAVEWKNEAAIKMLRERGIEHNEKNEVSDGIVKKKVTKQKREQRKAVCPLCNCTVKFPTRLSFLKVNQEQIEKDHATVKKRQLDESASNTTTTDKKGEKKRVFTSRKYLDEFMSHANGEAYQNLCKIEYHGVTNMHKIRKEISESYSILHAVQGCCMELEGLNSSPHAKDELSLNNLFLIDLCSGKSLTAALCAVLFPCDKEGNNNEVLAVDRLPTQLVPHFLQENNTRYLSRDIMGQIFFDELEQECYHQSEVKGRTVVLIGVHLCGNLSERAIELFHRIPYIKVIVLSPCCLPKMRKGNAFTADTSDEGKSYMAWSNHLKGKVELCMPCTPDTANPVKSFRDDEMHSIKNSIITATRPSSQIDLQNKEEK